VGGACSSLHGPGCREDWTFHLPVRKETAGIEFILRRKPDIGPAIQAQKRAAGQDEVGGFAVNCCGRAFSSIRGLFPTK